MNFYIYKQSSAVRALKSEWLFGDLHEPDVNAITGEDVYLQILLMGAMGACVKFLKKADGLDNKTVGGLLWCGGLTYYLYLSIDDLVEIKGTMYKNF
jgi:hypothetical protein